NHADYMTHVFYLYTAHPDLHSFPTRRSSDLSPSLSPLKLNRSRAARNPISSKLLGARAWMTPAENRWDSVRSRLCNPRLPLIAKDRKSTRLNSSQVAISYAVFCLKKTKETAR